MKEKLNDLLKAVVDDLFDTGFPPHTQLPMVYPRAGLCLTKDTNASATRECVKVYICISE